MNNLLTQNKERIQELCKRYHVKKLYAFGSATREDFKPDSDVDFLYEFDTTGIDFDNLNNAAYDYFENFFSLKEELEKTLKRKVDLLPEKEIKKEYMKRSILRDKTLIYGKESAAGVS